MNRKIRLLAAATVTAILFGFQNCSQSRLNGNAFSASTGSTPPPGAGAVCSYSKPSFLVDDFTYQNFTYLNNPTVISFSYGTATDKAGNIFSTGSADSSPGNNLIITHWIVRRSSDAGATWATVDDYTGIGNAYGSKIAVDAAGNVFVLGLEYSAALQYFETVRMSADHGATWKTVDSFQLSGGAGSTGSVGDIQTDAAGDVFVGLKNYDANGLPHAIIRKSSDHGATWTPVEDYVYPSVGGGAAIGQIKIDNAGNVYWSGIGYPAYVVGSTTTPSATRQVIRKSSDGGATWTTIEDYAPGTDWVSGGSLAFDGKGDIFVGGTIVPTSASAADTAIVRKTSDGGATWATVDTVVNAEGAFLIVDQNGNLDYATSGLGASQFSPGLFPNTGIIRRSTDGGTTWSTFENVSGYNYAGAVLSMDPSGNIYFSNFFQPFTGQLPYIVREIPCQ